MDSIRKFTLTIEDEVLRKRYLEENSRTILKTGLFFTFVWLVVQTIVLISTIKVNEAAQRDQTTMYILLGLIFVLQIVVLVLTWFLRDTKFLEYTIPLWITLTYFYINPREPIKLSIYVVT